MAIRRQIVTLDITYEDSCATKPSGWDWHDLLEMSPEEGVKVVSSHVPEDGGGDDDNPLDVPMTHLVLGAALATGMVMPGMYRVEQKSAGDEPNDFGMFCVKDDGSVEWTDDMVTQGWEKMRFTAHNETPESIGELIGDMIRENCPEQYTEDGEIVVNRISA